MHRRVAGRGPAGAAAHGQRVIFVADKEASVPLRLRMAAQAQIRIRLVKHLVIDRAVRVMATDAALAQRFVLEDKTLRLLAVAIRALFVEPRHRESAGRLHDVVSMRIVALHAVHLSFTNGMVLREVEIRVDFEMTIETGLRIASRINDELAATAADSHVFAARTMARFTTGTARHLRRLDVDARMRTGGENARVIPVAIHAPFVADKRRTFDFRWRHDRTLQG